MNKAGRAAKGLRGKVLTAGSRVGGWKKRLGAVPWGRCLADKDQTSEGAASICGSDPAWGNGKSLA